MDRIDVVRNGETDQFSVSLAHGSDAIRCMVSVAGGQPDVRSDDEKRAAALGRAKALAELFAAAIEEQLS